MPLSAERLPPEIWLYTFSFLEGHDLIRAFSDLNLFFNSLLHSQYLQLHIRIKQNESNQRLPQPIWSHINLQNIYSLSVGQRKANCLIQFLRWHAPHLIRLRSLSIYLRKANLHNNIQFLFYALQQLPSLIYIRIKCKSILSSDTDSIEPLMAYIFNSKYTIQICSFMSDISGYNIVTSNWSINPLLKHLYIDYITWSNLFSLLPFACQLHSLQANIVSSGLTSYTNFMITYLKKARLTIHSSYFSQLEMFRQITPNLQSLRLNGDFVTKDDDYFNENLWYKLFNNLKFYYVNLRAFALFESGKVPLRNRIRDYSEKSWFSWSESSASLKVNIIFKSTTV